MHSKQISLKKVLLTGFALDIPVGISKEEFFTFVDSLDVEKHPIYRLLKSLEDESLLSPLGFNEQETRGYHLFKERFIKNALL